MYRDPREGHRTVTSGSRGGATEHDVRRFRLRPDKRFTEEMARRGDLENILWVWQESWLRLKVDPFYWPEPDWLHNRLDKYGFETVREAFLRGVKGWAKLGDKVRGPENMDEAVHLLNYVNKVTKSLQSCKENGGKERGQPLQRKGPERLYV